MITIALVEDHFLFREGLRVLFSQTPEFEVVIEVSNGKELLEELKTKPVDVVLLDIEMPVMNGKECLTILTKKYPQTKAIMLTMHDSDNYISEFVTLGARGFLPKNCHFDVLSHAIETVHSYGYYFDERISKAMLLKLINGKKTNSHHYSNNLSDREVEILRLLCEEKSNQEIADLLFISKRTVESHRTTIMHKTNTKNVAGLVVYAIKNGILVV